MNDQELPVCLLRQVTTVCNIPGSKASDRKIQLNVTSGVFEDLSVLPCHRTPVDDASVRRPDGLVSAAMRLNISDAFAAYHLYVWHLLLRSLTRLEFIHLTYKDLGVA